MGIEQLVILILLVVVSLIRWLLEKSAELREKKAAEQRRQQTGDPSPAVPRGDGGAEPGLPSLDEAQRRLREALGLPPDVDAPRPVERRAEPPPVPAPAPVAPPRPPVRRPEVLPVPPFVFTEPKPARAERPESLERKIREFEADLERRLVETSPPPVLPEPVPPPSARPSVAKSRPPIAAAPAPASGTLQELLRTREGLRKAVLVQEILGPPKGLVF